MFSKEAEGNLSLNTTRLGSGASIRSTAVYAFFRMLSTPSGGNTILSYVALTSAAVNGEPSWNRTP